MSNAISQQTTNPQCPLGIEDLATNVSLFQIFLIWNSGRLDRPVVLDECGEHDGGRLISAITANAKSLLSFDVHSGDAIVVAMRNSLYTTAIVMAANALGVKVYLLDPSDVNAYKKAKSYNAKLAFVGDMHSRELVNIVASGDTYDYSNYTKRGLACAYDLVKEFNDNVHCDEPLIFLGTSGSTSEPKMQAFTNAAIYRTMICALYSTHIDNRDEKHRRLMTLLSIRLPFGFMTGTIPILWGQEVVYASGIKPEDIAKYHEYNPSIIFGTPALLQGMMALTPKDADLSAMKVFCSSGMPTTPELKKSGENYFNSFNVQLKIWTNYGFGEAMGMGTAFNPPSEEEVQSAIATAASELKDEIPNNSDEANAAILQRAAKLLRDGCDATVEPPAGSCGRLYVGLNGKILDEGKLKDTGEGELVCQPLGLMNGYVDNPKANEAAFVEINGERYFRTGDIVRIDDDGWVLHLGRSTRFYHTVGAPDKVSCDFVERQLEQIPFVKQAVIAPVPHKELGMVGIAFIVLQPGTCNNEQIKNRFFFEAGRKSSLQQWQLPYSVFAIEKIPVAKSGKTDYAVLKKMAVHSI